MAGAQGQKEDSVGGVTMGGVTPTLTEAKRVGLARVTLLSLWIQDHHYFSLKRNFCEAG